MSIEMVDHIVDEHHIDIDADTIKRVKVKMLITWFNLSEVRVEHDFIIF